MRISDWSSDVCSSDLATTLRSIGHIARLQRIGDNETEFVSAQDMLSELHRDNLALVESLREAKEIVDPAGYNGTPGLLDDWTAQAEERAWFMFAPGLGASSQAGAAWGRDVW